MKKDLLKNLVKVIRAQKRLPAIMVLVGAIWMIVAYTFVLYGALYLDLPQFSTEQLEQATFYGKMGIIFGFAIGTGGILMLKYRRIGGGVTLTLTILGFALRLISPVGVILPIIGGILGLLLHRKKPQKKDVLVKK